MENQLRIIFLGTPEFAVTSLKTLIKNRVNVVAVVTAPDKPRGRGKKLGISAVKDYAVEAGLPVLQPINLKSRDFIEELQCYEADLQIIVAFRMLPDVVWDMPRLGTFSLHPSLLPQYRGAAPINWAIINGEQETGVSTFFLQHEIDTGEIIFQEKEPIHKADNVGTLYQRLMQKGANLVLKTVLAIADNNYPQFPQSTDLTLKSAPKIFKEDCEINWDQPAEKVRDLIRGLSPYPAAWTNLDGRSLKVFAVQITQFDENKDTGILYSDDKSYLRVKTSDHTLDILELQLEGKKRMQTEDFLRGYSFRI